MAYDFVIGVDVGKYFHHVKRPGFGSASFTALC